MAQNTFVACRDCGRLHPLAMEWEAAGTEATDAAAEACAEFIQTHYPHRLIVLQRHGEERCSDRPLWDPMATVRFAATDGEQVYVVTAARSAVDEPRVYVFSPGALAIQDTEIALDDDSIRRGVDREFYPHALRPTKVDRLLSVLHDQVRQLEPEQLAPAFDDAEDPEVSIARMPDATFEEVVAASAEIFDPWEFDRVRKFLCANRAEDGVLALRVRRHLTAHPV